MLHGKEDFDKKYYRRFYKDYSKKELLIYERWHTGWVRFLEKYIPDLKKGNGKRVLEIGCSIGAFAKIMKNRGFEVVASDVSAFIVKRAKKIQKDIDFRVIDVENKINAEGKFDYIFAFEVLEHVKSPQKAIKNIYQKLKKEGVFIFSTPFPTKRSLSDPTHINVHNENYWKRLGKQAGFETKLVHASFVPFLYRFSKHLSWAFPVKTNIPFVNSTCIFLFYKK